MRQLSEQQASRETELRRVTIDEVVDAHVHGAKCRTDLS